MSPYLALSRPVRRGATAVALCGGLMLGGCVSVAELTGDDPTTTVEGLAASTEPPVAPAPRPAPDPGPARRRTGTPDGYWLPVEGAKGPLEGRMIFIFTTPGAGGG